MALNVVTAMFKAISPFGWIVIAISAVIAIVLVLYNYWDEIVDFFINTIEKISNFFKDLGKKINEVFQNVKQSIIDKFNEAKQSLVDTWNGVANWFNTKVIQPVANFFSNMWTGLKDGASSAWQGIKNIFSSVASYFGNIFGNAWNNVKNIFSTGGQIFMGIVDGITSAFKSIVNAIIDGINRVVSIPFNAINTALNGLRRISILGAKPFGWLPSIGVPKIPRLAKGGVLRQPTLNLAGEYAGARTNPEIVTPQKLLDERIAKGLANLENIQGNNQPIIIKTIIEMEGKQIAEVVNEYNDQKSFNMNGGLVWNT
jgi:predicted PurR-regulated permease PerM